MFQDFSNKYVHYIQAMKEHVGPKIYNVHYLIDFFQFGAIKTKDAVDGRRDTAREGNPLQLLLQSASIFKGRFMRIWWDILKKIMDFSLCEIKSQSFF